MFKSKYFVFSNFHYPPVFRCIWLPKVKDVEDSDFLSKVVDVFQHFGIICQLKETTYSDDIKYFIPWFVAKEEPKEATDTWMKHDIEENVSLCPLSLFTVSSHRCPTLN